MLLRGFSDGHLSKNGYAATLRAYKVANDAVMPPERHLAMKVNRDCNAQHVVPEVKAKLYRRWDGKEEEEEEIESTLE